MIIFGALVVLVPDVQPFFKSAIKVLDHQFLNDVDIGVAIRNEVYETVFRIRWHSRFDTS